MKLSKQTALVKIVNLLAVWQYIYRQSSSGLCTWRSSFEASARQTLVDVDSRVTSQTKLVKHGCERPRRALKHPQVKGGCKRGEKHERSFCVGHEAVKSCRAGASEVPTAGTKHRQLEV